MKCPDCGKWHEDMECHSRRCIHCGRYYSTLARTRKCDCPKSGEVCNLQ